MPTIATDQDVVTLVNVFTVSPERQQQLADLLVDATRTVMNQLPGFVSANIHCSLDGTKVVNYAQWRRVEDFQAMLGDPGAQEHLQAATRLAASVEPHLYRVVFTDPAGSDERS
jgi:antibiotic biosynthesis monooxygenase (ABM) superfamily enzyme